MNDVIEQRSNKIYYFAITPVSSQIIILYTLSRSQYPKTFSPIVTNELF